MRPHTAMTIILASLAPLPVAAADTLHLSATGTSLGIDTSCARSVTIIPDASLSGRVELSATAANPRELSQLSLQGGDIVRLSIAPNTECWRPTVEVEGVNLGMAQNYQRSLEITLRVPAAMPLHIEESGAVAYKIGAVGGPIDLQASGSLDLHADSVATLKADLSGSGSIVIDKLTGALDLAKSGSASFKVASGTLSAARLDLTGSGPVELSVSSIGALDIDGSGSATVSAGGHIGKASLALAGSGDITLHDATIDTLAVESSGSAETRITGNVHDANIDLSGSGNVWLPKVTGALAKDIGGSGEVHIGAN